MCVSLCSYLGNEFNCMWCVILLFNSHSVDVMEYIICASISPGLSLMGFKILIKQGIQDMATLIQKMVIL